MSSSIPSNIAEHLGFYVYLYIDPRTERVFYVGKGQGTRMLDHLSDADESRKTQLINELRQEGLEPRIDVLAHRLPNEETAFRLEAAVIDLLGLSELTNQARGWRSVQTGRMSLAELVTYYAAQPVEIKDAVLLIRVNRLYRHGMSETELYEATRGVWKVGERRNGVQYAFSIFEGIVREVYVIETWHSAGTTPYQTRSVDELRLPGRWEFTGYRAPEDIRGRYHGRSVVSYLKPGSQNPIAYVNA